MDEDTDPSPNKRKEKDRRPGPEDIDDILASITKRLSSLSTVTVGQPQTSDSTNEPGTDRSYLTSIFAEVLQCGEQEATFYLETALWDLVSAINLCLESGVQQYVKKNRSDGFAHSSSSNNGNNNSNNIMLDWSNGLYQPLTKKYLPLTVKIVGLMDDWVCNVNEYSGCLEFTHLPSGHIQSNVPPYFADAPNEAEAAILASISERPLVTGAGMDDMDDAINEEINK